MIKDYLPKWNLANNSNNNKEATLLKIEKKHGLPLSCSLCVVYSGHQKGKEKTKRLNDIENCINENTDSWKCCDAKQHRLTQQSHFKR